MAFRLQQCYSPMFKEISAVFLSVFLTFPNPVRKSLWKYHKIKIRFLSFFLSSIVWRLLPTHCRWRWLFLPLVTFNWRIHTRKDASGREIVPSQRHLPAQHTTLTIDIHELGGIRTHNFSKQAAADPRLRPHGHRYRLKWNSLADYLPIIKRYRHKRKFWEKKMARTAM